MQQQQPCLPGRVVVVRVVPCFLETISHVYPCYYFFFFKTFPPSQSPCWGSCFLVTMAEEQKKRKAQTPVQACLLVVVVGLALEGSWKYSSK